jgi:hypothetical protein
MWCLIVRYRGLHSLYPHQPKTRFVVFKHAPLAAPLLPGLPPLASGPAFRFFLSGGITGLHTKTKTKTKTKTNTSLFPI